MDPIFELLGIQDLHQPGFLPFIARNQNHTNAGLQYQYPNLNHGAKFNGNLSLNHHQKIQQGPYQGHGLSDSNLNISHVNHANGNQSLQLLPGQVSLGQTHGHGQQYHPIQIQTQGPGQHYVPANQSFQSNHSMNHTNGPSIRHLNQCQHNITANHNNFNQSQLQSNNHNQQQQKQQTKKPQGKKSSGQKSKQHQKQQSQDQQSKNRPQDQIQHDNENTNLNGSNDNINGPNNCAVTNQVNTNTLNSQQQNLNSPQKQVTVQQQLSKSGLRRSRKKKAALAAAALALEKQQQEGDNTITQTNATSINANCLDNDIPIRPRINSNQKQKKKNMQQSQNQNVGNGGGNSMIGTGDVNNATVLRNENRQNLNEPQLVLAPYQQYQHRLETPTLMSNTSLLSTTASSNQSQCSPNLNIQSQSLSNVSSPGPDQHPTSRQLRQLSLIPAPQAPQLPPPLPPTSLTEIRNLNQNLAVDFDRADHMINSVIESSHSLQCGILMGGQAH